MPAASLEWMRSLQRRLIGNPFQLVNGFIAPPLRKPTQSTIPKFYCLDADRQNRCLICVAMTQSARMSTNAPNIDRIVADDLIDNARLVELYRQAVRRRLWGSTERDFIEFVNRASKALHDDSQNSPEKLFRWLIEHPSHDNVSQACENHTLARFNSSARYEALSKARPRQMSPVAQAAKAASDKHPIGYLPGVFVQHCLFPQKRMPLDQRRWTVRTKAKVIEVVAGSYSLPGLSGQGFEVPYGIAPRLILPYIAGQAVKGKRNVILGKKMRQFLRKLGISPGSNNYRTILQQFINLATCQIVVSTVTDRDEDRQEAWLETDIYGITRKIRYHQPLSVFTDSTASRMVGTAQGSGLRYQEFMEGKPTFTLSHDFYEFVRGRAVPINYAHLLQFVRSPRRMDLYTWLSHRTYRIGPRGIKILLAALQPQFAPDLSQNSCKNFRRMLQRDLDVIRAVHPGFKVQLTRDALILFDSETPVPRIP